MNEQTKTIEDDKKSTNKFKKALAWTAGLALTATGVGVAANQLNNDPSNGRVDTPATAPQTPGGEVAGNATTLEPGPVDTIAPSETVKPTPTAQPTAEAAPVTDNNSHEQTNNKDDQPELPPGIVVDTQPDQPELPPGIVVDEPTPSPTPEVPSTSPTPTPETPTPTESPVVETQPTNVGTPES